MIAATESRKRIAMIVYNSVSHDARVIKEAETLYRAGHAVRIFGIQDNRVSTELEMLPSGIEIERVPWRYRHYRDTSHLLVIGGVFVAVAAYFLLQPIVRWVLAFGAVRVISASLALILFMVGVIMSARMRAIAARHGATNRKARKTLSSGGRKLFRLTSQIQYVIKRFFATRAMQASVLAALPAYAPDAVHCHDLPALPAGVRYSKTRAAKCVYDSHEIYEEQSAFGPVIKLFFSMIQRRYSAHVDGFITINESIATHLNEKYPKLPPAVLVRNATRPLAEPVDYDGRLHEAADLAPDVRILLYQGGYAKFRGLFELIRSAPLLPNDWCLVMMGWGAIEGDLRQVARQTDPNSEKVRFVAPARQAELPHWTAGGSIGIIPYENINMNHWLCTPNKLWEYPNAGVPLLVSPFPEMRKIVEHYGVGWLLSLDLSAQDIAAKVCAVDEQELERAKAACRKFVLTDNWTVYEEALIGLYSQPGPLFP